MAKESCLAKISLAVRTEVYLAISSTDIEFSRELFIFTFLHFNQTKTTPIPCPQCLKVEETWAKVKTKRSKKK